MKKVCLKSFVNLAPYYSLDIPDRIKRLRPFAEIKRLGSSEEMIGEIDWHWENDGRVVLRGNTVQRLQVTQLN